MPFVTLWVCLAPLPFILLIVFGRVAWRERRWRPLWPAGASVVVLAAAICVDVGGVVATAHYWDGWDLTPAPAPSELVGTYRHGEQFVVLDADGSYRGRKTTGTWSSRGSCLRTADVEWAILRRGAELVLLPGGCDGDPDDWNRHAVWERDRAGPETRN